jgi:succinate dehydrogenase / fumarate reductase cytochrome b subunit
MQTLGVSGKIWFNRWRCIGNIYATIVVLMFAAVVIVFAIQGCGSCGSSCGI